MTTYTYTFEEVQATRIKHGRCPGCRKSVKRRRTFVRTVNPFNKNPDGSMKSREQVHEEVNREADEWVPDFRHQDC